MTDLTSAPKVLPTTPGAATTIRTEVDSIAAGAAAPTVDRNAVWRFLKDSATRLLNSNEGKDSQQTAARPDSLSAETKETLSQSPMSPALGTSSLVIAGREVGLLMKVYLALKTLEDHLRREAVEGRWRFGRWVAGLGASTISFIASVFSPSKGADNSASHLTTLRSPGVGKENYKVAALNPPPPDMQLRGRSWNSEEHSPTAKEEARLETIRRNSLELDEVRRREKLERRKILLEQDREKHDLITVTEQQLLALALIDGIAGPEVFTILNGLRQPYASVGAVRDGIEQTNQADRKTLRKRFEDFFAEVGLATV